jgi:hypothetical protein
MNQLLDDVWVPRDLPVVRASVAHIDAMGAVTPQQIVTDTGLDLRTVELALASLRRTGYIACKAKYSGSIQVLSVSPRAYEVTGLHPNPAAVVESLVRLLEDAAERSEDPEEKSKLLAVAQAAGNVGGQVLANVIGTLFTRMVGG